MTIEPVPLPGGPTVPPFPGITDPPVKEPEPDRLPDEEPLPNPDENDNPPKWSCTDRPATHFSPCASPAFGLDARHPQGGGWPNPGRGD
jgi:hypothetical protein